MAKSPKPSPRVLALACFFVAIAAARVLHAEPPYWTDFRAAIRAYDDKNWADVAAGMRKAIDGKNLDSGELVMMNQGNRRVPYTPHLYLGIALAQLGRCDQARSELALMGSVPGLELANLKKARDLCPPPPPPPQPQPQQVKPPVPAPIQPKVDTTPANDTRAPQPVPPSRVVTPQPQPQPVPPSITPRIQPGVDALAAAKRSLQANIDEARRVLVTNQPSSPRVRDARTKLSTTLKTASPAGASSSPAVVAQATKSLEASLNAYRDSLGTVPPPGLADAIHAYAVGNYDGAISLLDRTKVPAGVDVYSGQAALFRAASRYAQYMKAGAQNNAQNNRLKGGAEDDVVAFRLRDPILAKVPAGALAADAAKQALDQRLFSPKFVSFVEKTLRNNS